MTADEREKLWPKSDSKSFVFCAQFTIHQVQKCGVIYVSTRRYYALGGIHHDIMVLVTRYSLLVPPVD